MTADKPDLAMDRERHERWEEFELGRVTMGQVGNLLPTKKATMISTVNSPAPDVYAAAVAVLERLSRHHDVHIHDDNDPGTGLGWFQGMFGSGFANMNFTLVTIEIRPFGSTSADLRLTGAAKEGLWNQHSSEKAVRRMRGALREKLVGVEISGEPVASDA